MRKISIILPLLLCTIGFAMDPPSISWTTDYGTILYDVHETSSNQFIVAGRKYYPDYARTVFLYDESGVLVWESGIPGLLLNTFAYWVEELPDGSFVASGICRDSSAATKGMFLLKLSSSGNLLWSQLYDFPDSNDVATCILPLNNGNLALCGNLAPVSSGYANSFVMVTDSQGDSLWSARFKRNYANRAMRILEFDDQLIVFIHAPIYGGGRGGTRIISFNQESGELLWEADDFPALLSPGYHGGDMTGSTIEEGFTFVTSYFPYIAHTDALGNLEWYFEIPYYTYPYGHSINNTMDGGYIYGGENTPGPEPPYGIQTGVAVKFDSEGNLQWGDIVWEIRDIQCIRQLSSGGYIVCGGETPGTILRYEPETGIEGSTPAAVEITSLSSNPFAESLTVNFNLNEASEITLAVYDLSGRLVEVIYDGNLSSGSHSSVWTPDNEPSGCYIVRLKAPEFSCVQNCVLIE